jgi:hypothetical protein
MDREAVGRRASIQLARSRMIWTAKNVTDELISAHETLFALPSRGGPRLASYWPQYAEISEYRAPRRSPSPTDIQRMETVLLGKAGRTGWLHEYLSRESGAQRCLARYAIWSAAGISLKVGCARKGWSYRTFTRNRHRGAQLIADALNAAAESDLLAAA